MFDDFMPLTSVHSPGRCEPDLKQFAHRRGPAWHPMLETKIVKQGQFVGRKHDLKALFAHVRSHDPLQVRQLLNYLT